MLNLDEIFVSTNVSLNESKKSDNCELDRVCTTFADIRNAIKESIKDIFVITPVQEYNTGYITFHDGDYTISPDKPGIETCIPLKNAKSDLWKLPK